jgi:hypothetical protein
MCFTGKIENCNLFKETLIIFYFVITLVKGRHLELIVLGINECILLFQAFCEFQKTGMEKKKEEKVWVVVKPGSPRVAAKCANFYTMLHLHLKIA